jgi:hypothetical protein
MASNVITAALTAFGAIVVACIPPLVAHYFPPPTAPFDCVKSRVDAVDAALKYPAMNIPFSGAQQDQCQLNEVVQQAQEAAKLKPPPKR